VGSKKVVTQIHERGDSSSLLLINMAEVPTPGFQTLWSYQIESLRVEYRKTIEKHPDAGATMKKVHVVLTDIASLAGCTPKSVGESAAWKTIITKAAETKRNLHQVLEGNPLYSALHGVYSEVLADLKVVLQQRASKVQRCKFSRATSRQQKKNSGSRGGVSEPLQEAK
jgi:hypothetical protein